MMKNVYVAMSLFALCGGTALAQAKPDLVLPIHRFCIESACAAAGGYCDSNGFCEPGCEAPPVACTASAPDPNISPGWVYVSCATDGTNGLGNGWYQVYFGPSFDGPWTLVPNETSADEFNGTGNWNGRALSWAIDEADIGWGANQRCPNPNRDQYCYAPSWVKVCADPGVAPFTKQSGWCQGNLEDPKPQCQYVQVTYRATSN
jgi:hypothetical protein